MPGLNGINKIAVRHASRQVWRVRGLGQAGIGIVWGLILFVLGSTEMVLWTIQSAWTILLLVTVAGALFLVPGLAVLRLLWQDVALAWTERLALGCAIGVALPPLMLQAAHLVRLPWTTATTVAYILLALLVLLAPRRAARGQHGARRSIRLSRHALLLGFLCGIALLVRLYIVRGLPVGMWGDSYQHTMIAQLLVDNRGLFSSWEPYAPLATFTYHYGFHANAALFHLLSGIAVPQSVIAVGQLLNGATLLVAYVLATRLSGNREAGLWAAGFTGFINTMPVYFVNWGRYTQLAGQVLLPVVLLCWMEALERERLTWRPVVLAAILTACLMLTHYIVTIFAALFVGAYLLARIVRRPQWRVVRQTSIGAAAIGGLAIMLAMPWLLNTLAGHLTQNTAAFVNGGVAPERVAEYAAFNPVTPFYLKGPIILLAVGGVVVALARRNWRVALTAVWSQLLLLLVVPHLVGLPGAGIVNSLTVYIALYLTAIPPAAYLIGAGEQLLDRWRPRLGATIATVALVAASIWGVRWQQHLLDPANQLFTPADARAMEWIKAHTPPDARFLVNMFPAFGDNLVAGSDGGWWIPLLTGRETTLPPLTYGSERSLQPDYARRVNRLAAALREDPLPDEEGLRIARAAGIDYIYSGAHEGQDRRIDVQALRRHPAFRVVYDQGGVTIFALEPAP